MSAPVVSLAWEKLILEKWRGTKKRILKIGGIMAVEGTLLCGDPGVSAGGVPVPPTRQRLNYFHAILVNCRVLPSSVADSFLFTSRYLFTQPSFWTAYWTDFTLKHALFSAFVGISWRTYILLIFSFSLAVFIVSLVDSQRIPLLAS